MRYDDDLAQMMGELESDKAILGMIILNEYSEKINYDLKGAMAEIRQA